MAESHRSRLSFLVEASGWVCHCDGRCSAARALLISNHIDKKEFTTAIFSALFHGWGKQRNTALLGSSANEGKSFIWAPMKEIYPQGSVLGTIGFRLSTAPSMWRRQIKVSSRASTFKMAVRGSQVIKLNLNCANKEPNYRGGPHMRSLISIDFPAPEMEPESVHVVSAVSVP